MDVLTEKPGCRIGNGSAVFPKTFACLEDRDEAVGERIPNPRSRGRQSVTSQNIRPRLQLPSCRCSSLIGSPSGNPVVRVVDVCELAPFGNGLRRNQPPLGIVGMRPLAVGDAAAAREGELLRIRFGRAPEEYAEPYGLVGCVLGRAPSRWIECDRCLSTKCRALRRRQCSARALRPARKSAAVNVSAIGVTPSSFAKRIDSFSLPRPS